MISISDSGVRLLVPGKWRRGNRGSMGPVVGKVVSTSITKEGRVKIAIKLNRSRAAERLLKGLVALVCGAFVLLAAPCHASGIFSFFNPEVTTPVSVKPVDHSDIVGGMKATVTLGSLGSVITSHLALIIFGFLLYAAIRRLGEGYHARVIGWHERRSAERIERARLWNDSRANWRNTLFSILHPSVAKRRAKQDARGNVMAFDVKIHGLEELNAAIARMEEIRRADEERGRDQKKGR